VVATINADGSPFQAGRLVSLEDDTIVFNSRSGGIGEQPGARTPCLDHRVDGEDYVDLRGEWRSTTIRRSARRFITALAKRYRADQAAAERQIRPASPPNAG